MAATPAGRDADSADLAELEGLIKPGGRGAPSKSATKDTSHVADNQAKEAPKEKKPKTEKPPSDEQLVTGMRIVCRLTWTMSGIAAWLFAGGKLAKLTDAELDEWARESLGFARAMPGFMAIVGMLGFPGYLLKLATEKFTRQPKGEKKAEAAQQQAKVMQFPGSAQP